MCTHTHAHLCPNDPTAWGRIITNSSDSYIEILKLSKQSEAWRTTSLQGLRELHAFERTKNQEKKKALMRGNQEKKKALMRGTQQPLRELVPMPGKTSLELLQRQHKQETVKPWLHQP